MYKVIGADGAEYGPVDVETLKQWAVEGRVRAETRLVDAESGLYIAAGIVAELRPVFGGTPAVPATAPPGYTPAPKRNAALIVMIILLGSIIPITAIVAAILFPVFAQARFKARETASLSNLKQVDMGLLMYVQDNDQRFPPMDDPVSVKALLMPYTKNDQIFYQPSTHEMYQVNRTLSRKTFRDIAAPPDTVTFYEPTPASSGGRAVGFADGHVRLVTAGQWERLKAAVQ